MSGSLLWSQITLSCVYPFGFPDPTGVNRVGSQAYLSETRASSQVKILLSVSNVIFHPPDVPLKASHTQKPRNFKLSLGSTDASYSLQVKEDQSWALMVPNGILFLRADSLQCICQGSSQVNFSDVQRLLQPELSVKLHSEKVAYGTSLILKTCSSSLPCDLVQFSFPFF